MALAFQESFLKNKEKSKTLASRARDFGGGTPLIYGTIPVSFKFQCCSLLTAEKFVPFQIIFDSQPNSPA